MLLSIEKLIYGGDGLARTPAGADGRSMAVFVPFVLPGEQVEAEIAAREAWLRAGLGDAADRSVARSRRGALSLLSAMRRMPLPAHSLRAATGVQGGILRETLQRVAKIELKAEIRLHASPPWNYRNRTRLQVRTRAASLRSDIFGLDRTSCFRYGECPISSPLIQSRDGAAG